MSSRVVVLGEVMLDVVAAHDGPLAIASDTPARISLRPGGAGANTAAWLARAGADVTLIARVGNDDARQLALRSMDGVDLRVGVDPDLRTGTCIVLVSPGGERTMLPDPGANTALTADELPDEVFTEGAILHVSGYSLMRPGSRGAALEAMGRARDAGMLISVDPASAALLIDDPAFLHRARPVDLLLPNEDELAALGGDLPGVKEFAVSPCRRPSPSSAVTTVTPVTKRPSTRRSAADSEAVETDMSGTRPVHTTEPAPPPHCATARGRATVASPSRRAVAGAVAPPDRRSAPGIALCICAEGPATST